MLRTASRALTVAGFGVLGCVLLAAVGLYVLGGFAGPAADHRPLDYGDDPANVTRDALHNLWAADYTYRVVVTVTDERGRRTTLLRHVEIRNGARVYRARVRDPVGTVDRSEPAYEYFGTGMAGYRRPPGEGWERHWSGLEYSLARNAFGNPGVLTGEDASVVVSNESTYVARVTDRDAVFDLVSPYVLDRSSDANATLTVTIDRRTGRLRRAVVVSEEPGETVRVRYRFRGYGSTHPSRPWTALPGVREALYRMDLGLRVLEDATAPIAGVVQ